MEEVYHLLITLQDDVQSQQMAAYMRDQFAFLGIRTPVRRQVAKSALTEAKKSGRIDWSFVELCWASDFREHHYLAIDYLLTMSAHLKKADLPKIEQLLLVDPWWDTVDALSGVVAKMVLQEPTLKSDMSRWSTADSIWLRRSAIIHQLLLKEQTDTDLLRLILLNNLGTKEFFINKAIGWSLRDYAKTDAHWIERFLAGYSERMASLSIKEAKKYFNQNIYKLQLHDSHLAN